MKLIKLSLSAVLVLLFSCNNTQINRPKGKEIEISWELIENEYDNKNQFLSEFVFTNKSKFDLSNKNWVFYFNYFRKIKYAESEIVDIEHVNGDFCRLVPKEKFFLPAGKQIKIKFVSQNWAINKTDAPVGGFFVFDDTTAENCKEIKVEDYKIGKNTERNANDVLKVQTSENRFNKFKAYGNSELPENMLLPVIPSPVHYKYSEDTFLLNKKTVILFDACFEKEADFLKKNIETDLNIEIKTSLNKGSKNNSIYLIKTEKFSNNPEAYKLFIKNNKIEIIASGNKGIFYGIQSLRSLISPDYYAKKQTIVKIKGIEILDYPSFEYRGMHLDIARNFQSKKSLLKLLDVMAFYKLNKLHLHFCDDEGWRIQINGLPELTDIGAKRAFSQNEENALIPSYGSGAFAENNSGTGYYTRNDFIEILKFAKKRKIEVIPEIDMPGHARAAIVSMKNRYLNFIKKGKKQEAEKFLLSDLNDNSEYQSVQGWNDNVVCVCNESVYAFLDFVINDLSEMYKEAEANFNIVHIGGDEVPHGVWKKSPVCDNFLKENPEYSNTEELQKYFILRVNKILNKYNLKTAGWEEIALNKTKNGLIPATELRNKNIIPYIWNNVWGWGQEDIAYKLANADFPVVMCNATNLYFDLAYEKNPDELGYYWAGFVDTRKVYEFTPYDIRKCTYEDLFGNKINANKEFAEKENLKKNKTQNILGIQGQLWSENIHNETQFEYMIFPRLLALAERAWAKQPNDAGLYDEEKRMHKLNTNWNIFANTSGQKELPRLDFIFGGIKYRISPPSAIIKNDTLTIISEFPGTIVRYTTDGNEPDLNSTVYTSPVKIIRKEIKICSFTSNGRKSETVILNK